MLKIFSVVLLLSGLISIFCIYRKIRLSSISHDKMGSVYKLLSARPAINAAYFIFLYNTAIAFVIMWLLFREIKIYLWVVGLSYFLGLCVTYAIYVVTKRRIERTILMELPGVIDLLLHGFSVGATVAEVVADVAKYFQGELAILFKKINALILVGYTPRKSIEVVLTEVNNKRLAFVFELLVTYSETGGDVISALRRFRNFVVTVNNTLRKIDVIAEGSKYMASIFDILLVFAVWFAFRINPKFLNTLLGSPSGRVILAVTFSLVILGHIVIAASYGKDD